MEEFLTSFSFQAGVPKPASLQMLRKSNLLKMMEPNWIVSCKAGSRLQTQFMLLHLVQVAHGNVLMLVRCSQSISPCLMLLPLPPSRAPLLWWVWGLKRPCTVEAIFSQKAVEGLVLLPLVWRVGGARSSLA